MVISAAPQAFPAPRTPARAGSAVAAQAQGLPADAVTLDPAASAAPTGPPAPPVGRSWLWSSLESAQAMGGQVIGGPLGAVLTAAQQQGLGEVLTDLQAQGARIYLDKGFWGGILSKRHQTCSPAETMELIREQAPEFDAVLWVQKDGESQRLRNLADLRDAAVIYGAESPSCAARPDLVGSLEGLQKTGWKFVSQKTWDNEQPVGRLGAYRVLTGRASEEVYRDDQVALVRPGSPEEQRLWVKAENVGAADYFYGSGSEQGLQDPALARGLKALAAQGVELEGRYYSRDSAFAPNRDPYRWYNSLREKSRLSIELHDVEVYEHQSGRPEDLAALQAAWTEWHELDEQVLAPAVKSGVLPEDEQGRLLRVVSHPLEGLTARQRTEWVLGLLREDPARNVTECVNLLDDLVDRKLPAPALEQAAARARELTREFGSERARAALRFLLDEVPKASRFENVQKQHEAGYLNLARAGASSRLAEKALEQARLRVEESSFEQRVDCQARLFQAGRRQEGYDDLIEDYRAVLEFRRPGERLDQAAKPMLALLEGLAAMGQAEQAREAYRNIREGLEQGALEGNEQELIARFLQAMVLKNSPEEARDALRTPPTGGGTVKEQDELVQVGGVVIPKKPRP